MPVAALHQRLGPSLDTLQALGAAEPSVPLSIVTCPACYGGHTAEVGYNPATRRSSIFCAEAGCVVVPDAELATVQPNLRWLPDQLTRAFHVAASPPRKEIVRGAAWLLGDTVVGRTRVSIALATTISSTSESDHLIDGLCSRKVAECGLLLAYRCTLPNGLQERTGFTLLDIMDVVRIIGYEIEADQVAFNAWVRSAASGQARPKTAHGRPSIQEQVQLLANARAERNTSRLSDAEEARLIRDAWVGHFPDQVQPGISTIRKHLQRMRLQVMRRSP